MAPPARQRELFLDKFVAVCREHGFGRAEATAIALEWLPDILPYDHSNPAGFPNGRRLDDDVVAGPHSLTHRVTRGQNMTGMARPHADLLPHFPYLGPPHPAARP